MYVELIGFIFRGKVTQGWTGGDLQELESDIYTFNNVVHETFTAYKSSGIYTSKWHSIYHIVKDLHEMGGIEKCHCGFYENSLRNFKEGYNLTSKRVNTAIKVTIDRQLDRSSLQVRSL